MTLDGITLTDFTALPEKEKLSILHWRNHENIRKWMFTDRVISEEEHLSFLNGLNNDPSRHYFLASSDNIPIGVIYFTNIDPENKNAEFGLYSKPESKSNGTMLMSAIREYGFNMLKLKKLYAEVLATNEKAIKLYKKFGFRQTRETILKDQKILCMELVNEDR